MKYILVKLKIFFGKNHEHTTRHIYFKFDPFPTDSVEFCLFMRDTWKSYDTQKFGTLCIKYDILFYKTLVVQLKIKYLIVVSQKILFLTLGK
jgi:hypothetical protein